jgi:hypothetical protein
VRRIPDSTIGLRAYKTWEEPFEKNQPHPSLVQERLLTQLNERHCGLIVDGGWGSADLIFPFAVYEAKKEIEISILHAADQVYHAHRMYLAMLDDLARNPEDLNKYQTPESGEFRVFGFTSQGAYWRVYVASEFAGPRPENVVSQNTLLSNQ